MKLTINSESREIVFWENISEEYCLKFLKQISHPRGHIVGSDVPEGGVRYEVTEKNWEHEEPLVNEISKISDDINQLHALLSGTNIHYYHFSRVMAIMTKQLIRSNSFFRSSMPNKFLLNIEDIFLEMVTSMPNGGKK